MMSPSDDEIRARMRQIREDTGLTQELFVGRLNATADALFGAGVKRYRQDTLSKIENRQSPTFVDVAVWSSLDPKRRGKVWLAWGEDADSALAAPPRRQGPSVIQEPPPDTFDQPIPRRKPGQRRA